MKKLKYQTPILVLSSLSLLSIGLSSWIVNDTKSSNTTNVSTSSGGVCYIDNDPSTLYTTIEKALEIARDSSRNDIIYVIPGTNPTITGDCVIDSGDTLCLPYEGTTWENSSMDGKLDNFADGSSTYVDTYRKNNITINEGVSLTNKGTLIIGGILGQSSNNSNQRPTGHTVGNYCQISLDKNSSIKNYGAMTCFGYIKYIDSNTKATGKVFNYSGSTSKIPLVFYDYKGGAFSGAGYNADVFPFNVFDFPNIQVENIFYSGAELYCNSSLIANNELFTFKDIKIIGTSSSLFSLSSGKLSLNYTSYNFPYTSNDSVNTTDNSKANYTAIKINGDFTLGSISISFSSFDFNSADYFLPMSYKFKIYIESGSTTVQHDTKFLSGSYVNISSGANMTFNGRTMFYETYIDDSTTVPDRYPKNLSPTRATLINNGNLTANSAFSGGIFAEKSGATVTTGSNFSNSLSVRELISAARGSGLQLSRVNYTYKEVSGNVFGYISNDENTMPTSYSLFNSNSTYTSKDTFWVTSNSPTFISDVSNTSGSTSSGYYRVCFDSDTMIITERGILNIKEILSSDKLLSFNHFTGKFEFKPISAMIFHGDNTYQVIKLEFSDGNSIGFINSHGLFDVELNKYVDFTLDSYQDYIGHHFLRVENNSFKKVKLVNAYIEERKTGSYTILSSENLNCVANDMLNITSVLHGIYNIFNYDKDYKYCEDEVIRDIEKYGLFTYDDFKDVINEKIFIDYGFKWFKISIGKGFFTMDTLQYYIEWLGSCIANGEAVIY